MTLDRALDRFYSRPTDRAAWSLLATARTYFLDEMIGREEFQAIRNNVFRFLRGG